MSFVHSVVTGATGQVGLELCRGLRAAGKSVRAVVLPGDPAQARLHELGVEIRQADVRDASALRRAVEGATHLYHLAAIVSTTAHHDLRMWQVNVEGARNAARAARELGVRRMIYFSSIVVFDPEPLHEPLHEGRPRLAVAAGSPYVRSKVVGEATVREQLDRSYGSYGGSGRGPDGGPDVVVVHPTVVIGPNETHHVGVVQTLLFNYFAGRLPAVFAGGFDAVAVGDVVDGAMAAAERGRAGESYILGGEQHTVLGLLRRAQPLSGTSVPRLAIPLPLARAGLPVVDAVARITRRRPAFTPEDLRQLEGNPHISTVKAHRELGYRPNGLDRALAMVHEEWLRGARSG